MKRLMEEYDNYALSISVTTRDPRPGEEDGVSYFFRTEEEFDRMVEEDAFLEYARYVKHSYGTPKAYVEEQLDAGKDVLLEIEIQGALQVKEKRPDTLLVFITPPTACWDIAHSRRWTMCRACMRRNLPLIPELIAAISPTMTRKCWRC